MGDRYPDIVYISTSIGGSYLLKTPAMLSRAGCYGEIIGLTRDNYPSREMAIPVTNLGNLSRGRYFSRLLTIRRVLPRIREKIEQADIVYCFSLDSLVIGRWALGRRSRPIVYHVHDIRSIQIGGGFFRCLVRLLERFLLRKVSRLVVSSPAFYTEFYRRHYAYPESKVFVIENKMEEDPLAGRTPVKDGGDTSGKLRIGYYGLLRCRRAWEILNRAVEIADGDLELYIRGVPYNIPDFTERINSAGGRIHYGGPYRGKDDLESMYSDFDIVWAAYPYGHTRPGNWQWAKTVRFYEAGAFLCPSIVLEGTRQAREAEKYDIGLVLNMDDVDRAAREIVNISRKQISLWRNNLEQLPRSLFIHSGEYERLAGLLREEARGH